MVNYGTVQWVRPPISEELKKLDEQLERSRQRTEEWERKTLERLRAKYGDGQ
jgi:hypothetical protein